LCTDGQPGSYQLARWVSTEKRARVDGSGHFRAARRKTANPQDAPSLALVMGVHPLPPIIQVHVIAAPIESKDSLRRRTMRLADEVYQFVVERVQHHPPSAYPDSRDPNPSDERKQAIKLCQEYDQETLNQYMRRYQDRMIGIVREYNAKGVRTRYLENDFKQRVPGAAFIGSDWENSPSDELSQFRDLAYHVDASDNAIHISD
jgi:hypothetical protein